MGEKHNSASLKTKLEIAEFLKANLTQNRDNTVTYTNEYSDDLVAKEIADKLSVKVTPANVAGVRLELFGQLRPRRGPSLAELESQMQSEMTDLRIEVGFLRREVDALKTALGGV